MQDDGAQDKLHQQSPSRPANPPEDGGNPWTKAGLALMIPSVMAAGPLAGLLIAWLVRRLTGWGDWVTAVLILLGLAAGVRETIRIIRRLS